MRAIRNTILALAAIAIAVGLGTNAYAFHSGGVAECSGCHSMHSAFPGGASLLVGGNQSSTCLSCHQSAGDTGPSSYHISTAEADMPVGTSPLQRTPGGDFGWLKKTYTWAGRGGTVGVEAGQTHGHNIVAGQGYDDGVTVNYNYNADTENTSAPGGGASPYPAADLTCVSCHDPHGKSRRLVGGTIVNPSQGSQTSYLPIAASGSYTTTSSDPTADTAVGVYRLLGGPGYKTFTGAPAAIVPSSYNRSEASSQTKVAYGHSSLAGNVPWGVWCGTCHPAMHQAQGGGSIHPVDQTFNTTIKANYNKYVKTGDLSGTSANSFNSLVPFLYDSNDYDFLQTKAVATNEGLDASTNGRVSCMSCHRAHASAWEYAVRWNPEYEFLTDSNGNYYNGSFGGRGRTSAEVEDSYYDRPSTVFARSQRSLCNKCHIQD